jgi:hypothetical protein
MAQGAITLRRRLPRNPACVQPLMFWESRMGITMFTLGGLFAPLQALMGWVAPAPKRERAHRPTVTTRVATCRPAPRRPLRVVRVVDGSALSQQAGRMVISGRMADVCAELDRLAALEARAG